MSPLLALLRDTAAKLRHRASIASPAVQPKVITALSFRATPIEMTTMLWAEYIRPAMMKNLENDIGEG